MSDAAAEASHAGAPGSGTPRAGQKGEAQHPHTPPVGAPSPGPAGASAGAALQRQVEHYFGAANWARDDFLRGAADAETDYVPASLIASFPKVRGILEAAGVRGGGGGVGGAAAAAGDDGSDDAIDAAVRAVAAAVADSTVVEVDETGTLLRRRTPFTGVKRGRRSVDAVGRMDEECTVFVGNLDARVTEELLYELALQVGPVREVRIPTEAGTGERKPFGFVEFAGPESVAYAVFVLHQLPLFGRAVRVAPRGADAREDAAAARVFVRNLSDLADDAVLLDLFSPCGSIAKAHVVYDAAGRPKGFGFVAFDELEDGLLAVRALDGLALFDRRLAVTLSKATLNDLSEGRMAPPAEPSVDEVSRVRALVAGVAQRHTQAAYGAPAEQAAPPPPPPPPPAPGAPVYASTGGAGGSAPLLPPPQSPAAATGGLLSPPGSAGSYGGPPPSSGASAGATDAGAARVFVGNLSEFVDDTMLLAVFLPCGRIAKAHVVRDAARRSKRYAFVAFNEPKDGLLAVRALDGVPLFDRRLSVTLSTATVDDLSNGRLPPPAEPSADVVSRLRAFVSGIAQRLTQDAYAATAGQAAPPPAPPPAPAAPGAPAYTSTGAAGSSSASLLPPPPAAAAPATATGGLLSPPGSVSAYGGPPAPAGGSVGAATGAYAGAGGGGTATSPYSGWYAGSSGTPATQQQQHQQQQQQQTYQQRSGWYTQASPPAPMPTPYYSPVSTPGAAGGTATAQPYSTAAYAAAGSAQSPPAPAASYAPPAPAGGGAGGGAAGGYYSGGYNAAPAATSPPLAYGSPPAQLSATATPPHPSQSQGQCGWW